MVNIIYAKYIEFSSGSSSSNNSTFTSWFSATSRSLDEAFPNGHILPTSNLKIFTFAELKNATGNFGTRVGRGGGFNRVFKGWIDETTYAPSKIGIGMAVAVKILNQESLVGLEQWQSEVNFLGRLSHPNLVKLLGYCLEDKKVLLVYEFMQKGSWDDHLFRRASYSQPPPWDIRLKVAIGAARGLAFLHTSERQVIFRGFNPSNILLDGSYNPKLSDSGLAKMCSSGGDSHVTTSLMGLMATYGYVDLEYIATGHLYVESDVYGFGVVLLEMLTGRRVLETNRLSGKRNLVDWAKPFLANKRKLKDIMDSRLEGQYPFNGAFQAAELALKCLERDPRSRPSMKEVVEILDRIENFKE